MELKKGFTLIELLVVIAIVGILATIVMSSLGSARTKAKSARALSDMRQIGTIVAAAQISSSNNLYEITGSDASLDSCVSGGVTSAACASDWQTAIDLIYFEYDASADPSVYYEDPWGNPYLLDENEGVSSVTPCIVDTLASAGPDGVYALGTGDDVLIVLPQEGC